MVHGRWIRVVWATSWRCEFPPRLVAGLAVTQETESVCLGRLKRAVVPYMINMSFSVFIRQILESIYMFVIVVRSCVVLEQWRE